MNPQDKKPDTDLDRDLDKVRQAYRSLDPVEPPALIDQRILNKARRAVAGKTGQARWLNWRWLSAVSMTAVVVLTLALVMDQAVRTPQLPEATFQRATPEKNNIPADKLDGATSVGQELDDNSRSELKKAKREQPISEDPQEQSYFRDEAGERARQEPRTRDARLELRENAVETGRVTMENEAEAGAYETAAESGRRIDADAPAGPDSASESEAFKPSVKAADKEETGWREAPEPEAWLQSILQLKQSGQTEAFARELEEFIRVYPDYPLPEALQTP